MRYLLIAVIITVYAGNAIAQDVPPPVPEEKDPNRWGERLGGRIGYVGTSSGLDNSFGSGINASLHWIQMLREPFGFNFMLGAFAMGNTGREDITDAYFFPQNFDDVSMRIINFSLGPMAELKINDRLKLHLAGRGALYTVTLFVTRGIGSGDSSDNHLGVNGTVGLIYRLTENWFIDLDLEGYKMFTSSDTDDLFWVYSEGDKNPFFYVVNIGVMLRLF